MADNNSFEPDYFGGAQDLISGISTFFGDSALAKGSAQAAAYYNQAANITAQSTKLKTLGLARQAYQVQSSAEATIGGGNLATSGTANDVLRSNAQQVALTRAITEQQGQIEQQAYLGQAGEAAAQAKASKAGGKGGLLGGVVGAAGAVFGV